MDMVSPQDKNVKLVFVDGIPWDQDTIISRIYLHPGAYL